MQNSIVVIFYCLLITLGGLDMAYAARVKLPRTGQTLCYHPITHAVMSCGTGQDGDKLKGASWPTPRFTDNLVDGVSNGTVTDNLTGLIWLKNANCSDTLVGIFSTGTGLTWANALT